MLKPDIHITCSKLIPGLAILWILPGNLEPVQKYIEDHEWVSFRKCWSLTTILLGYLGDHECAWFWKRRIMIPILFKTFTGKYLWLAWVPPGYLKPVPKWPHRSRNILTIMNEYDFENAEVWHPYCLVNSYSTVGNVPSSTGILGTGSEVATSVQEIYWRSWKSLILIMLKFDTHIA